MHKSQVLFCLMLAFLGGVLVSSLSLISQVQVYILLSVAVGLLAVSRYLKTFSSKGLLVGVAILIFVFGIIRFDSFNFANDVLSQFVEGDGIAKSKVALSGYIDSEPDISGPKSQFIFRTKELSAGDLIIQVDEKTLVQSNAFPRRQFGDKLSISGSLKLPENFSDFDYVQYLKNKSVRTIMAFPKIADNPELSLSLSARFKINLYKKLFTIKGLFEKSVGYSLSQPHSSYINGILLGSKQDIPDDIKEAFNKTGTSHILAISGYNITIIADALLMALTLVMRRRRAFWVSVVAILLFTILTGASSSVVRASIMGLLLIFANGHGRLYEARNGLMAAASLMVFLNPSILVFDIGFQLSFLAVLGLIYVYPSLDRKFKKLPKIWTLKENLLMTISAQTLVFPLLIYYFKQFSLVSLPANILVLPLMSYTMFFGFMTGLGGLIFIPLGRLLGIFAWGLATYQLAVINWFGSLSWAAISISIDWVALLAIYAILGYNVYSRSK